MPPSCTCLEDIESADVVFCDFAGGRMPVSVSSNCRARASASILRLLRSSAGFWTCCSSHFFNSCAMRVFSLRMYS
ncbi:MAG: hypothetical protein ACK55Z_05295, partial [bacterium]